MGKMLDVFKQANTKTSPTVEPSLIAPAASSEPSSLLEASDETVMPFIEVGGKNEKMEGSADVMAFPVAARPFVLPAVQNPTSKPRGVALASRETSKYRGVRLQPLAFAVPQWVFFSPRFAPELIAAHDPRHPVCGQYEALLSQILGTLGGKQAMVLCFLGALEQSGTTTTVLNLALTAAHRTDQTVTVVEANGRRPALAQRIGLETPEKRSHWYQARKPANLRFVPCAEQAGRSLLSILEVLREDEGLILIDGPELKEACLDALLPCDGLYVIASEEGNPTPPRDLGRPIDGWIISQ